MLKTPFFGNYYNVIAPLLILIFGIIFGSLGLFKYNSKTLEAIVLFSLKKENTS
jgi:fumarate reductase subunit D